MIYLVVEELEIYRMSGSQIELKVQRWYNGNA